MTKAPTSRPLRRKTSHSVIERRRREKINEGLISLQQVVPACRQELKELLDVKSQSNKCASRKTQAQLTCEADRLLEEKIGTQMVLEKLCIISHTVDYVRELQDKVEAYRRLCECSPILPAGDILRTHDSAHASGKDAYSSLGKHLNGSEAGRASTAAQCQECSIINQGKRHWGSNNPIQLSRHAPLKRKLSADADKVDDSSKILQLPSRQSDGSSDDDASYLELDEWHDAHTICFSSLYTNQSGRGVYPIEKHRRVSLDTSTQSSQIVQREASTCLHAPLGLLADVSEDIRRSSS